MFSNDVVVRVELIKCFSDAVLPKRSHNDDVGWDLCAATSGRISPGKTATIRTGLKLANELYFLDRNDCDIRVNLTVTPFMKIESRSGLALRGIFVVGGIIDNGYRGEILVPLHNSSINDFEFDVGSRIAQLVVYMVGSHVNFCEVNVSKPSARNDGGFGSTG